MTISQLKQEEPASLDHDQLSALYVQLGAVAADDVLRRAMEELALRLGHLDTHYSTGELKNLRKGARALIAIADQVGMSKLATVSADVCKTIDQGDMTALAATLARLLRVGECSLMAIWDLQDITV